jgi:hypothetical protein
MAGNNTFAKREVDTANFLKDYNAHIKEILTKPSGEHVVDPARVKSWVDAQASERRRIAAAALASNIRYITHHELIRHCETLMEKMYTDPEKPISDTSLKWFVGPKTKSSYFISLICYDIVIKTGKRPPDKIICENLEYEECTKCTLFYLDDMSYSGSQIYNLLLNIHVEAARHNPSFVNTKKMINMNKLEAVPLDIRIGICVLTERAEKQLSVFNYKFAYTRGIRGFGDKPIPNPYKRYSSEILPDLNTLLGDELFTDCLIYFNPYSDSSCICYFDHKVADSNSTFTNVLRFGVVPPTVINYNFIYEHNERRFSIYKKYYTQEKESCDKEIVNTQFIPFITNCQPIDARYLDRLQALPYHVFMIVSNGNDEEYNMYNINTSKNRNLYNYKNSADHRCPKSWYKNLFRGGTRKNKSRRNKTHRKR